MAHFEKIIGSFQRNEPIRYGCVSRLLLSLTAMAEEDKSKEEIAAEQPSQPEPTPQTQAGVLSETAETNDQPADSLPDSSPAVEPPITELPAKEAEPHAEPKASETPATQELNAKSSESKPEPAEQIQSQPAPPRLGPEFRVILREAKTRRREAKIARLLDLARKSQKVSNRDIRKRLGISDATATRYASELIRRGLLKKSGRTKSVRYETM